MVWGCAVSKKPVTIGTEEAALFHKKGQDTVHLGDETSTYDIIIIEPGFNFWLSSMARPRGFYSQSYMEQRNQTMVIAWNQRVLQPNQYDPLLYELQIDYRPDIDYGYEVNYKLYNYFIGIGA